ncbi:MAG: WD40 repeat domain-containing protein, partial [Anaerolineales bacterium]|nr:WD40 repeat domain-containing protein [Anaerolineales bacterium]
DQVFSLQHDGAVSQARWSANETRILTSGRRDGTARIWDVESGEQLSSLLHGGSVEQAEWNTDETQIMTGGNGYVMIWDLDTGTNTINRLPHESSFAQASWNADETRILTSNSDGVRVWDLETGTHSILFKHGEEQFQKEPISVSWNSTKTRILTTNNDNTAQVWDATSGEQLLYLPKTEDRSITQAIWNIDDSLILTINGSTVQVWDAENDDEPLHILRHDDDIYRAIWTNGNRILTHVITEGGFKTIMTVWDAQTGELLNRSEYNDDEDFGILWNADGTRILSITGNNLDTVTIWNVSIGGQIQLKHENRVNDAIWNIDGTQIATISGNDVQVWNVETGDSVVLLEHESGFVQGASWSADKKRISTIISNTVQVWDAETGDNIASLLHDEVVKEAKWNADGTNILTVSATHIYLWDVLNSVPLLNVRTQIDDYFTDVNWNADETRILINIRNVLQIWDVETGNRVAFLELPITPSENLITLNADETLVFAGHEDGTVRGYFVQMEDFVEFACEQTPRNMTQAEWQRFMGDEPYSATCPNLPLEE